MISILISGSFRQSVFFLLTWTLSLALSQAWYLPGSAPKSYEIGEPVQLKVDKLTSSKTQLPFSYYTLPVCRPEVIENQAENLGEILKGDLIQNSAYDVRMGVDETCKLLCVRHTKLREIADLKEAIDNEYMATIMADNLPAAMTSRAIFDSPEDLEIAETSEKSALSHAPSLDSMFLSGIPVGMVDADHKHVLVNHLNFLIRYHKADDQGGNLRRVVGFEVTPQSIYHGRTKDGQYTCDSIDLLTLEDLPSQTSDPLRKDIVYTYSVKFVPSTEKWATRWSAYLAEAAGAADIHWFSIVNALVVVVLLSGIVGMILLRTLLRDIARYNHLDDVEEAQEESGWKLVHGDVFRRPVHSKLLAVCAGTGVQLLGMCFVVLLAATIGFISPANRGALLQTMLALFTLMGVPAGYASARFNKLFDGENTSRNLTVTSMTALQFPGVSFAVFFIINVVLWSQGSSGAVPFGTMFVLLLLWFGISLPLVFVGSYLGYRKEAFSVPVRTNQIPRQIPPSHWLLHPVLSSAITGILPFSAIFTELLFIMGSVWHHRYYYLFGFLFLVVIILVVTCSEISIALTYFQLSAENYRWWWASYWASASSAIYVFLYGVFYFYARLSITKFASVILYFGYTLLMSYAFCLLTGAIGFISAFFFVRVIYGAVKVD